MVKKKDKLDKALHELQTNGTLIDNVSGEHIVEKIVEVPVEKIVYVEKIVEVPVEKIVYVDKVVYVDKPEETNYVPQGIQQIGVKSTYLPFVLTKLNICSTNTDGRSLISKGMVKINGVVVTKIDVANSLSNFLLEVNGNKWEVFKID